MERVGSAFGFSLSCGLLFPNVEVLLLFEVDLEQTTDGDVFDRFRLAGFGEHAQFRLSE